MAGSAGVNRLGELANALGLVSWRFFVQPTDVEMEIIDMAIFGNQQASEIWTWPRVFRSRFQERFIEHKKAEKEAIDRAARP